MVLSYQRYAIWAGTMGRPRKSIAAEEARDVAKWLYRHFEETGHNRAILRRLDDTLRSLQMKRRDEQERALADLQTLTDELPAELWNKVTSYLRMMAARQRRDLVSIELPRELKARLGDYQQREGLPSVVAAVERLLS